MVFKLNFAIYKKLVKRLFHQTGGGGGAFGNDPSFVRAGIRWSVRSRRASER